jgi:hypothetical protein
VTDGRVITVVYSACLLMWLTRDDPPSSCRLCCRYAQMLLSALRVLQEKRGEHTRETDCAALIFRCLMGFLGRQVIHRS